MVNKWNLPFGKVVAVVEIYDCVGTEKLGPQPIGSERLFGDYAPGRFAWLTRNPRRLVKPIPVVGRQFFFDLPKNVELLVKSQL